MLREVCSCQVPRVMSRAGDNELAGGLWSCPYLIFITCSIIKYKRSEFNIKYINRAGRRWWLSGLTPRPDFDRLVVRFAPRRTSFLACASRRSSRRN